MDVVSGAGCSTCILWTWCASCGRGVHPVDVVYILWTWCLVLAVARASCGRGVHPVDVVYILWTWCLALAVARASCGRVVWRWL